MKSNNRWNAAIQIYLKWFFLTFISFLLLSVLFKFAYELGEPLGFLIIFFPIPIVYGILGLLQSRLMHLQKETFFWILQSLLMMGIFYYLSDYLENLRQVERVFGPANLLPGFLAGGILGGAQFYILKKIAAKAMWWIPTSMFSCGLSFVFGWDLLTMIGKVTSHATPNLFIVGIINASITGVVYYFSFPQRN